MQRLLEHASSRWKACAAIGLHLWEPRGTGGKVAVGGAAEQLEGVILPDRHPIFWIADPTHLWVILATRA